MFDINPFVNPQTVENYETWYYAEGKNAADQEKNLILRLLGHFPKAKTMLEVGCGTGYFSKWFTTLGIEVIGLDISRQMLLKAREFHHLSCVQGDALALPMPDRSADLVSMITTLEFITKPIQALSEALRVTRDGLILGVINKNSILGWQYLKKGGSIWSKAHFYSPSDLKIMLLEICKKHNKIIYQTTLWPLISISSVFPWGGFIGMSVVTSAKDGEKCRKQT